MRFSSALSPNVPQDPGAVMRALAASEPQAQWQKPAQTPWPADAPPDDLDQRVREAGEW